MSPLLDMALIIMAVMAIVFASITVFYKSLVYSAVFLAFLGLTNAAIFYIIGYPLLAFIQIIIYVGSGVLFIIIAVSMLKQPSVSRVSIRSGLAFALFTIAFLIAIAISIGIVPISVGYIGVQELVSYIASHGEISIIILLTVLSFALIASISIAVGDEK